MKVHKIKIGYENLKHIVLKKSLLWSNAYITWYNFVIFNTDNYLNTEKYTIDYDPVNYELLINNRVFNKTDYHTIYELYLVFESNNTDDDILEILDVFRNKINI